MLVSWVQVFSSENEFVIPSISDVMQRKLLLQHAIHPQQNTSTCYVQGDQKPYMVTLLPSPLPCQEVISISDSSKGSVSIRICVWLTERINWDNWAPPSLGREFIPKDTRWTQAMIPGRKGRKGNEWEEVSQDRASVEIDMMTSTYYSPLPGRETENCNPLLGSKISIFKEGRRIVMG